MSKVLEHIIHEKVTKSISSHISTSQFGFMKGRSTLQQLLIFLKDIYEHKTQTDVIYLDFSKAFDRVPHNELLLKLWQIGITGTCGGGSNHISIIDTNVYDSMVPTQLYFQFYQVCPRGASLAHFCS